MSKQVDRTAKAAAVVNAGSAIKAKIKEALEDLGRGFEAQRRVVMDALLDIFRQERDAGRAVIVDGREQYEAGGRMDLATQAYYAFPHDLHLYRDKHKAAVAAVLGEDAPAGVFGTIENLFTLRLEVKAVEVVKFERKEPGIEEKIKERVLKTFEQFAADRRAQFDWATEIVRELNKDLPEVKKMPVSCRPVYCRNDHGTTWIRIDWYFRGEKVAFNVIAAAAQTVADEKKGA